MRWKGFFFLIAVIGVSVGVLFFKKPSLSSIMGQKSTKADFNLIKKEEKSAVSQQKLFLSQDPVISESIHKQVPLGPSYIFDTKASFQKKILSFVILDQQPQQSKDPHWQVWKRLVEEKGSNKKYVLIVKQPMHPIGPEDAKEVLHYAYHADALYVELDVLKDGQALERECRYYPFHIEPLEGVQTHLKVGMDLKSLAMLQEYTEFFKKLPFVKGFYLDSPLKRF